MTETIQLSVTGMTCGGCEHAVTRALKQITGVRQVTASHAASQVEVTFDKAVVTPQMLRERIEELGYSVAG